MTKRILSMVMVIITVFGMLAINVNACYSEGRYMVDTTKGVNVRTGAGTEYSKVGAAKNKTTFYVSKIYGSWGYTTSIKCTNGTKSGWVALDYCTKKSTDDTSEYFTEVYTVNTYRGVNVRKGAGLSYSKVGAAKNGTTFTVTKKCGSWGYTTSIKCTNGTKSGWVALDYCTKKSTDTTSEYPTGIYMVFTERGMNVRTGAGTGYSKVGASKMGTVFTVTKVSGEWGYTSNIRCTNGTQSGWILLKYCRHI